MITPINRQYKITCERCGKTEYADADHDLKPLAMGYKRVSFADEVRTLKKGDVCNECYKEFCELAENFFDEVNKENEGRPVEKPKAILISKYSNNHFGSMYKCPLCDRPFGSWEVDEENVRCPGCKAELGGIS